MLHEVAAVLSNMYMYDTICTLLQPMKIRLFVIRLKIIIMKLLLAYTTLNERKQNKITRARVRGTVNIIFFVA